MNGHRRLLAGVHRQQIGTQIIDDKEGQRDHTAVPDHPPGQYASRAEYDQRRIGHFDPRKEHDHGCHHDDPPGFH